MKILRLLTLIPLMLALCGALPASAQSLIDLYQSAKAFDANYQAARSFFDASLAKGEQARAALLPSANLAWGVNRTHISSDTTAFDRGNYGNQSATLMASQPIYRPANLAIARQGSRQVELAQAQLQAAEQDLMVRVSQAYFDVLAAQDSLNLVKSQKEAVAEQLASAKRNFEVGTSTITDTREAQARFDLVLAQDIAADNDVRIKILVLDQLTGKSQSTPKPLKFPVILPAITGDVTTWLSPSDSIHPLIRQARIGLEMAQLETQKAQAGNKPTLDLTGSYNITHNNGSAITTLDYRSNVTSIGLNLNWPLFAGFSIQNRIKETLALEEKSRADLEAARRGVTLATRSAFLGVQSGLSQVQALEAAQASSQSALAATQLGYSVGVRINIDVLNSQSLLFDTKTKLAKARYEVLLGTLKLRFADGSLQEDDLKTINTLLAL
jgi:outer membrane protein